MTLETPEREAGERAPGRRADSGMRSQVRPPSVVWKRMAGLPMIHPSLPEKEMDW